jgi:superfamily II DNA helicase RecQ
MEKDMIQNIAEGEFAIVFAHPEALLNTVSGKDLLSKRQFIDHVKGVVIDGCHIVKEW